MMERIKTGALVVLVAISLMQSYFLAYSIPRLGATVKTEQEYVQTETMGQTQRIEQLIYPEDIVLHAGDDSHTILYPSMTFFDTIYEDVRQSEFRGFQRVPMSAIDWEELRTNAIGLELRFGGGIPVSLLRKVMSIEGDLLFLGDTIDRIWIARRTDGEEAKSYFFSASGEAVYEASRSGMTAREVAEYVGFGEFREPYREWRGGIYVPAGPVEAFEYTFAYASYSPEQMQRNLFFDPEKTRNLEDWNGSQIYTDGKRGLQLESNGTWMVYTDPVAPMDSPNELEANVLAALQFVNQHGGWDGRHRLLGSASAASDGRTVVFQQYYHHYPLLGTPSLRYGRIKLVLQQGIVSGYERSLITRGERNGENASRWLEGGDALIAALDRYARAREVANVFPALTASQTPDGIVRFEPVWAVRHTDGTVQPLMSALPVGVKPAEPAQGDAGEGAGGAADGDGEPGDAAAGDAAGDGADGEAGGSAAGDGAARDGAGGGAAGGGAGDGADGGSAGPPSPPQRAPLTKPQDAADGSPQDGAPADAGDGAEREGDAEGESAESGEDAGREAADAGDGDAMDDGGADVPPEAPEDEASEAEAGGIALRAVPLFP